MWFSWNTVPILLTTKNTESTSVKSAQWFLPCWTGLWVNRRLCSSQNERRVQETPTSRLCFLRPALCDSLPDGWGGGCPQLHPDMTIIEMESSRGECQKMYCSWTAKWHKDLLSHLLWTHFKFYSTGCLVEWLLDWLTGCLTDWVIDCMTDWLTVWLTGWLTYWMTG